MAIQVSDKTRQIVCRELKVNSFADLVDRDFQEIDENHDVDRNKVARYADRNRGSVRLDAGKFYTAKEYEQRIRRVKNMKLPG
ncbi:MAG TPA: hypothetical protein DDY14_04905 [Chromatiaceae bacterium]|jgi:hypothetical protein|nr:MAG: hypothetical protein N838_03605 [Thiohalocapsa sp. PB-PSB1]QQO54063.1 MAG: hypothetical protein N838_12600 [Thiohalocapsa sp. PB-PSB1]HBG94663.1 hypothetical protein [Chromatiaceae bacterium]HCS92075.1 hypothetical protein [Chromatiaceae bacterium]